jgi:hypothetical protein
MDSNWQIIVLGAWLLILWVGENLTPLIFRIGISSGLRICTLTGLKFGFVYECVSKFREPEESGTELK